MPRSFHDEPGSGESMRQVLYILGQLDESDVDVLLELGRRRRVAAGTSLVAEGARIDHLYVLLGGQLSVASAEAGGREINRLAPGEVVGELSFLEDRPASASVTAVAESDLLAIDRDALARRLESDTRFGARFYRALGQFLSQRLRRLSRQLPPVDPARRPEPEETADDLDAPTRAQLDRGAARFELLLGRLRGSPGTA